MSDATLHMSLFLFGKFSSLVQLEIILFEKHVHHVVDIGLISKHLKVQHSKIEHMQESERDMFDSGGCLMTMLECQNACFGSIVSHGKLSWFAKSRKACIKCNRS